MDEMEAIGLTPNAITYGALLNRFCREQKPDAVGNLVEKMRKFLLINSGWIGLHTIDLAWVQILLK